MQVLLWYCSKFLGVLLPTSRTLCNFHVDNGFSLWGQIEFICYNSSKAVNFCLTQGEFYSQCPTDVNISPSWSSPSHILFRHPQYFQERTLGDQIMWYLWTWNVLKRYESMSVNHLLSFNRLGASAFQRRFRKTMNQSMNH